MSRSPYSDMNIVDGYVTYNMKSWEDFNDFLNEYFLKQRNYIWRGQANSEWLLETTLDRLLKKFNEEDRHSLREKHLDRFRYSIRGRYEISSASLDDDECWALGQHYGLATPLLDWTVSPFIAAFFAVNSIANQYPDIRVDGVNEKYFALFALDRSAIWTHNKQLHLKEDLSLKVIEPLCNGNPRLVNQGGLFTKVPISTDVESWVKNNFKGEEDQEILLKFIIPYKDIDHTTKILMLLNRMNINHLSLFPDLQGSSHYCNLRLMVPTY